MKRIIGMLVAAGAVALAALPARADEGRHDRDDGGWSQQYRRDDRGRWERVRRDRRGDRTYRYGGEVAYEGDGCQPQPRRRDRYADVDVHRRGVDVHVGVGGWLAPER